MRKIYIRAGSKIYSGWILSCNTVSSLISNDMIALLFPFRSFERNFSWIDYLDFIIFSHSIEVSYK